MPVNPKAEVLGRAWGDLIRSHHDAFAVELLGSRAAGVTAERLQELLQAGLVNVDKLGGLQVPGMRNPCDPFLFARLVAQIIERTPSTMRAKMRDWPLSKWKALVDAEIDSRWREAGQNGRPAAQQVQLPLYQTITVDAETSASGGAPPAPPPQPGDGTPPPWLAPAERRAYVQALERGGEFCRGLGNTVADTVEKDVAEAWAGEDIVQEVQPTKRQERLDALRELTADAMATHRDAGKLARDLADATEDWAHNWKRIARTELQAVYNEGKVLDAYDAYGDDAGIARLPETGACDDCLRLYLDGGKPRVFPIREIVGNGTNVGRKPAQWKPTVFPTHPHCACDTLVVPPGMMVERDGRLRRLAKP